MKHLKTYKIFESGLPSKEFLLDIQDIILEIEDMRLHIKKSVNPGRMWLEIVKNPRGLTNEFEITEELYNTLVRIYEFSKQFGYSVLFDVNMGADDYYHRIDIKDIERYIGESAWFITITITNIDGWQ